MSRPRIHIFGTAAAGVVWVVAVALGLRALMNYENAPGAVAEVPKAWPASHIQLAHDRPTLVMLAHPHCPCTRASVGELAEVMARIDGKAVAYVLFSKPADSGTDWDDTGLLRTAAAIPGVTVVADPDGAGARRFGAETSGHTVLFAPDGRLLFSGGITQSRGHAGDNAGASAIVSLVHNGAAERPETFVFGCALPIVQNPAPATLASK